MLRLFLYGMTIGFIILKLLDKTDISWWWVFSPFLIYVVIISTFVFVSLSIGIPWVKYQKWRRRL